MAEDLCPKDAIKSPSGVAKWKNYLSSPEVDFQVYENIESLRQDVEDPEKWIKTKELAKQELADVPGNIIPQLFERLKPYLETLPGGHSKNHVYRDFVSSLVINQDPWVKNLDDVERFIGIMGGTFHDIGNSVISRYEDNQRFAGHAETGAFLFGEIAKDLLRPNLLKLSQFSIAAHTHYPRDIEIKRIVNGEEKIVVKKPYNDTLDEQNNKAGIWLTQWADRLDAQGVQMLVRSAMTKAEPISEFDSDTKSFHRISKNEIEDFSYHFNPRVRSDKVAPDKNLLEHIAMFRKSSSEKSIYSQHDSLYYTNELVKPCADEQMQFVREVLRDTPVLSDGEINKGLETFYTMCRLVDNGINIEKVIDLFKRKFSSLPKDQLSHWTNGFSVLPKLYNQMLSRMGNKLQEANGDQDQRGIFKEASKFALQKLEDLKKIP